MKFKNVIQLFKPKIYFTIHTGKVGFTDQLMQFSAFYKLGRSLGFEYIFTPFNSHRSKPLTNTQQVSYLNKKKDNSFNVYHFLGFNQFFSNRQYQSSPNSIHTFEIELGDSIIKSNQIHSFESLQEFVKNQVKELRKGRRRILVVFRLDRKPTSGKTKRLFFSMIHSSISSLPDGLDLRAMYFSQRIKDPVDSPFDDNACKLLIHIRQGDTGFIDTPWNSFIPVNHSRPDFMVEQNNLETMTENYANTYSDTFFSPNEYYHFLVKLLSFFDQGTFSILVCSDGYQRAFHILNNNIEKLALDADQIKLINNIHEDYDDNKFSMFKEIKGCKTSIGETEENLRTLIHAALTVDVIIVAAQQRMLPKLAANYCETNRPFIIVLYRKNIPDFSDIIQNDGERYYYIDIDNPEFSILVSEISKRLSSLG